MQRLSVQDVANFLEERQGLSKQDAESFVIAFFELISEGLNRDRVVKVKGLGTFKIVDVKERESVNVNTGERVTIEEHSKIAFTPDAAMRDFVNKPFAQFDTIVLNDGVDIDKLNAVTTFRAEDESLEPEAEDTPSHLANDGITSVDEYQETTENASQVNEATLLDEDEDIKLVEKSCRQGENEVSLADDGDNSLPLHCDSVSKSDDKGLSSHDAASVAVAEDDEEKGMETPTPPEVDSDYALDNSVREIQGEGAVRPKEKPQSESEPRLKEDTPEENEVRFAKRHGGYSILKIVIALFLIIAVSSIALFIGYYWGNSRKIPVVKYVIVHAKPNPQPQKGISAIDTMSKLKPVYNKDIKQSRKEGADVKHDAPEQNKKVTVKSTGSLGLRQAAAMVRTGAYRIAGTSTTVRVRKGETLNAISARYLGPGMECYVQIHNATTEAREGMEIKIPKLKLKKK